MELFEQEYARDYFDRKNQNLKSETENLSDVEILNTNIAELKEYFFNKYYEETIQLHMDKMVSNIEKSKLEQYNPFYEMGFGESPTIYIDSCKINYSIPFSGNSHLLHLTPSMNILSTFEIDGFENLNSVDYMPCMKFSTNLSLQELEKSDNPQKYIDSRFENDFKSYQEMINYLNNDIITYNSSLEKNINSFLNNRKSKADIFSGLIQKLNIPLKINDSAPSVARVPLNLKKETKSFPTQKQQEESWSISEKDYSYIKSVISQACNSFEHSPIACQKLNEEELRDMLLGNLNTHFDSSATGETFSKAGKTDIRIQFKNKSAYIAECKIWHGISEFKKAITQLFSYTTWRDIKTSLIIFNKEIKDFTSIVAKIKTELNTNDLKINVSEISKNEWQCTFRKTLDSQELIQLHVIVCDIYI